MNGKYFPGEVASRVGTGELWTGTSLVQPSLRTFARNFSNIDFFLKILPLKDDELAMSEM